MEFDVSPATDGSPTGRCLVIVAADAERTMCTYLGRRRRDRRPRRRCRSHRARPRSRTSRATSGTSPPPRTRSGARASLAARGGPQGRVHALRSVLRRPSPRRVPRADRGRRRRALRQRRRDHDALRGRLVRRGGTADRATDCEIAALTCGAPGSVVVSGRDRHEIAAVRSTELVDTTGAGDAYAAGFLYGLTHGLRPRDVRAARLARRGRGHLAPRPPPRSAARRAGPAACWVDDRPLMARLPRYRTGDPELDQRLADLIAELGDVHDSDLVFELMVSAVRLARERVSRGDLKMANAALKEMRYGFTVFEPYRSARKAAIFGSARTTRDDPLYEQTVAPRARARRGRLDGHHRRRARDHGSRHRRRGRRPTASA